MIASKTRSRLGVMVSRDCTQTEGSKLVKGNLRQKYITNYFRQEHKWYLFQGTCAAFLLQTTLATWGASVDFLETLGM